MTLADGAASRNAVADGNGRWVVSGLSTGRVRLAVSASGFRSFVRELDYEAHRPVLVTTRLEVGSVAETVEVAAEKDERRNAQQTGASSNVLNLQKRVAGVLPIPIDVPRSGASYRFVRPLVVEEETRVNFQYRAK